MALGLMLQEKPLMPNLSMCICCLHTHVLRVCFSLQRCVQLAQTLVILVVIAADTELETVTQVLLVKQQC